MNPWHLKAQKSGSLLVILKIYEETKMSGILCQSFMFKTLHSDVTWIPKRCYM